MSRSFTLSVLIPTGLCVIALLWLLWCFIALTLTVKWLISLVLMLATAAVLWSLHKCYASTSASSSMLLTAPSEGPVVLVYGSGLDSLFADENLKPPRRAVYTAVGRSRICAVRLSKYGNIHRRRPVVYP